MVKEINLFRYICPECNAAFKIEKENGDSSIGFCPYCGIIRNEMGDDTFDGEFIYKISEDKAYNYYSNK